MSRWTIVSQIVRQSWTGMSSSLLYLQCWVSGLILPKQFLFFKTVKLFFTGFFSFQWMGWKLCIFFFSPERLKLWREFLSIYDSCFFYSGITGRHFVLNKYIFSEVYKRSDMCCWQFSACCNFVKSAAVLIEILYFLILVLRWFLFFFLPP